MFVDASAIVAILMRETPALRLAAALSVASGIFTSPVAVWESVAALVLQKQMTVVEAEAIVRAFLEEADIAILSIDEASLAHALEAYARFGKGRHPARLNMGDCFAYGAARARAADLLCVGEDFPLTDARLARW